MTIVPNDWVFLNNWGKTIEIAHFQIMPHNQLGQLGNILVVLIFVKSLDPC